MSAPDLLPECAADERAALPRSNGELVFAAPWESRAFAMAVALSDQGAFVWADFQSRLIVAIDAWEATGEPAESYLYYERWLEALEALMADRDLVATDELAERIALDASRPAGHDHRHDHGPDGHGPS